MTRLQQALDTPSQSDAVVAEAKGPTGYNHASIMSLLLDKSTGAWRKKTRCNQSAAHEQKETVRLLLPAGYYAAWSLAEKGPFP